MRCVSGAAWVGSASTTYAPHTAVEALKQVYRVTSDTAYALSKMFNNLFIHRESQIRQGFTLNKLSILYFWDSANALATFCQNFIKIYKAEK